MKSATHEPIPEPLRDLIIDLACAYRPVPHIQFPRVVGGRWDSLSLDGLDATVSVDRSVLRLSIDANEQSLRSLYDQMSVRNMPIEIQLESGQRIAADIASMHGLGEKADVRLYHWRWQTDVTPLLWIGLIRGKLPHFGNLFVVESGDGWSSAKGECFRLDGRITWYVLPPRPDDSRVLVIVSRDDLLEREVVQTELAAFQFSVGGSLSLDHLIACDSELRPVGAISVGGIERPISRYRIPVAHKLGSEGTWIPILFGLLAEKSAAEREPLVVAIMSYLDAEADHLDGAYLKLRAGLETFCSLLNLGDPESSLVADSAAWEKWLNTIETQVTDQAVGPDARRSLSTRLRSLGGGAVRAAARYYGLELPEEAFFEIEQGSGPRAPFLMNSGLEYEIDRDARRVEMLQTVLVAFVAAHIGYRGPIAGYDVAPDGGRVPPAWWDIRAEEENRARRYLAERTLRTSRPRNTAGALFEFAMLIKVTAVDTYHLAEMTKRTTNILAPHVVSLHPVDLEFAVGARDVDFMTLALEQARACVSEDGRNSPRVGALVVRDNALLACGYRGELKAGEHAEYTVFERKLRDVNLSGATLYTTLEPCTKRGLGKTACLERVLARGLGRVVIGTLDPNPSIKGEGVMRLREAGIAVQLTTPSIMAEIERLNTSFSDQYRGPRND